MQSVKQKYQLHMKSRTIWAVTLMAILALFIAIFAFSNIANASNSGISCAYKQTGPSDATIQVTGVSSYTATSSDTSIATVLQEDEMVKVSGLSGAVGVVNINISYGSSSTYTVAVPIGYTVFSFNEDKLTVMPGNSSNYEINGIDYTAEEEVTMTRINPETETYPIYQNDTDSGQRAKLNINLKKKGGTYVFTGTGNNMSIAVAKEAATTSTILMADCHLTSGVTSPLTIKKKGTVQTVLTALEGHSNSLSDNEFNNADTYGPTEEGGSGDNQYWAESAVIKGKDNANLLLNGTGNLTLNCKSKNAVKIGDAGNLTIEDINLDIESVDHGISSDNTATVNSGSLIINSTTDAFRSDPDEVVAGTTSGSIAINGGTFNIVTSSTGDGIQAASTLTITGGCFNIKTYGGSSTKIGDDEDISAKGIKSGTTMAITDGDFVFDCADDAIHAESDCTISGGEFRIATGDDGIHAGDSDSYPSAKLTLGVLNTQYPKVYITTCYEGLEAPQVIINSGIYRIEGTDDGINAANGTSAQPGQSAGCNIVVNGGSIYVNVDGDGFDANGNLTINAGTCVVFGQTSSGGDNNPYDCDGTFTINGGTVFGAGGNNPAATAPSSGSQGYITYGGGSPGPGPGPRGGSSSNASDITSGKTIDVKNASSSTAFSVKTPKTVNYVIYSDNSNPTSSWSITGDSTDPTWTLDSLNMPTCLTNGHTYTSTTIIEPTCLGSGTIKKTCTNCDATSYETVDALGHDMVNNKCSRCGHTDGVSIATAEFDDFALSVDYTGAAYTPTPTVTLNETTLVKDTDYTLSYKNNVSAGTATIIATGIGDYTGTATTTFTIKRAGINTPVATDQTYDGSEKIGVPFGTGYSLTNNKKTTAGNYIAYATPDSNHKWIDYTTSETETKEINWIIKQAEASINFNVTSATVLINATETITPTIVTDGSFVSCESNDTSTLTASYDTDTGKITLKGYNTGNVTVTLSFAAGTNYNAVSAQLTVNVNTIGTAAKPVAVKGLVYNGSSQTGVIAGTGYTVTDNVAINADEYTAIATLNSGYTWADGYESMSREVDWSISKANGSVTISASTATVSYGTDRKIGVTILGDGEVKATSSNTNVAEVSYSDSQITINPKAVSDNPVTITVESEDGDNYFGTTDSCIIYVVKGTGSTDIYKESVSLPFGGSTTTTVTVVGDGTTTATSSDESIATATLEGSTLTINAFAKGNATITVATTEGTNYTASSDTCAVSVYVDRPILEEPVVTGTNITLNWTEVPDATKYAVATRVAGSSSWTTHSYDCKTLTYTIKDLEEGVTYDCLVQAYVDGKWSTFSSDDIKQATTKSIRPAVSANPSDDGQVTLSWGAIDNATDYVAYEVVGSEFRQIGSYLPSTQTSLVVNDLANGYKHTFLVQAKVGGQWSKYSDKNYASATPTGTVKPTLDEPVVAGTSITLTWTHVPGVSAYAIATKVGSSKYTTYTMSCTEETYTIKNLEEGVTYDCLVQANINGNWSSFDSGDLKQATTKGTRPVVTAEATGDGEVTLTWAAIDDADKYAAYEVIGNSFNPINENIPSSQCSVVAKDLANGYEHTFLVQSNIDGVWTKFSENNYTSATPTGTVKPKITSATVSGTNITLSWEKVPGASKYAIATKVGSSGYTTYSMDETGISYTIKGLEDGVTYDCLVQANINGNWSLFDSGDLKQATTKGTRPVVTAEATGDGEVTLTWAAIDDADKYAAYEVIGNNFIPINENIPFTQCSVVAKDLANDYEHTFLVQSNIDGVWSKFSENNYRSATPTGTVKPKITSATVSGTNITLSWGKVPGASKYAIATKVGSSGYTTYSMDETGLSYTIKGLEEGVTYDCLVQANINGKWSSFDGGDLQQATTKGTRPVVTAEATGDGEVTLTWDTIDDATKYVAYEVINGQYAQIGSEITAPTTTVTKTDLVNEQQHTFLVQAYVGGTWSKYSENNYVYATPHGAVKPTINSFSSTETTITVNWDAVSGSDGYCAAISTDGSHWTNNMLDKTATTYTFTGLQSSTAYKVLVQRRVGDNWSEFSSSDIKSVTTKQPSRITYSATGSRENAILCNATTSTYDCIKVEKSGAGSSEDDDFYGYNAAVLAKAGGLLTINDAIINTAAKYANAVFSYGSGTTVNISNSTINTTDRNSGGVMVTGGGILTATDVNATTSGDSSAPIRSDKGGGTLTTNRGTYISKGIGSPAIYSTAAIKCIGSTLTSNHSEGLIVEGKNSATLNNCTLTDTNDKLNGQSTTYKNIFLYQSQSGDAEVGTAEFAATDSTITTNKGDSFYVTNNTAKIDLNNNTITNNDATGYLLRAKADAWGKKDKNGGLVTFNLTNQEVTGNIYIDNISTLAMSMKTGSKYTGTINGDNTAKTLSLNLSTDSNIVLTGDSYLTSFTDEDSSYSNVYTTDGHLYVNGVIIK